MIPGDPAAIEAGADELARAGRWFQDLRDDVVAHAREMCSEWIGVAGARALLTFERLGDRLLIGADACREAPPPLRGYAGQLRMAQREYDAAADRKIAALARFAPQQELAAADAGMDRAQARAASANQATAELIDRLAARLDKMWPDPPPPPRDDGGSWISLVGHTTLDALGALPAGFLADLPNAAWYAAEGNYGMASVSLASAVPIGGWFSLGGKYAVKATDAARGADRSTDRIIMTSRSDTRGVKHRSGKTSSRSREPLATVGQPSEFNPHTLRGRSSEEVRSAIPDNWTSNPSRSGEGVIFRDLENPGRQIRIMPGYRSGNRPDALTHGPYVSVTQNGQKYKIPLEGNPTLP